MRNVEYDALSILLKSALGNTDNSIQFDQIEWESVIRLAEIQGVISCAFDGLKHLSTTPNMDIETYLTWLGKATSGSDQYDSYVQTVSDLAAVLSKEGIKMMVMKGLGCSLNYPVPSSRPCGDIDIWLFGDYQKANQLIGSRLGTIVDYGNPHHAVFPFEGRTVENHASILDINVHKSNRYLNDLLEELADEADPFDINGQFVYLPSVRFNSIHLLRHMASDFATINTNLKQVMDWATFVSHNDVDWNFVREISHKAQMNHFLDAINGICVSFLGYASEQFPIEEKNVNLQERVLSEILENRHYGKIESSLPVYALTYGLSKTVTLFRNRWKHKMVYDESLLETFWWKTKSQCFGKKVNNNM